MCVPEGGSSKSVLRQGSSASLELALVAPSSASPPSEKSDQVPSVFPASFRPYREDAGTILTLWSVVGSHGLDMGSTGHSGGPEHMFCTLLLLYTHTGTPTYTHAHTYAHMCVNIHAHTCVHTISYMHMQIHVCTHIQVYAHVNAH